MDESMGLHVGDKVTFWGYPGFDGHGEIVDFSGFGLFAHVRTRGIVSGDVFVARVAVMNMRKDGAE